MRFKIDVKNWEEKGFSHETIRICGNVGLARGLRSENAMVKNPLVPAVDTTIYTNYNPSGKLPVAKN
jgi:hypothetical protein